MIQGRSVRKSCWPDGSCCEHKAERAEGGGQRVEDEARRAIWICSSVRTVLLSVIGVGVWRLHSHLSREEREGEGIHAPYKFCTAPSVSLGTVQQSNKSVNRYDQVRSGTIKCSLVVAAADLTAQHHRPEDRKSTDTSSPRRAVFPVCNIGLLQALPGAMRAHHGCHRDTHPRAAGVWLGRTGSWFGYGIPDLVGDDVKANSEPLCLAAWSIEIDMSISIVV